MSARAAFAAVATGVLAAALAPWAGSPLRRLAGGEGDGPAPRFDAPLDAAALERAEIPREATYFLSAAEQSPLVQGNTKAAAQLYLAAGLPVVVAEDAGFVVRVSERRLTLERR